MPVRDAGARARVLAVAAMLVAASALSATGSDAAQPPAATCRTSQVAVGNPSPAPGEQVRAPGATPTQKLFVKACVPRRGPTPSAVQVLVHGITYDHRYWDLRPPQRPHDTRYSWQEAAARAGYATVALDRIGSGRSTHPPGSSVTADGNAAALDALVRALRAGAVPTPAGKHAFTRVVLVGHSYGSTIALLTAAQTDTVDAVVLTGFTNGVRLRAHTGAVAAFHPVGADPAFRDRDLDEGYLTTRPGTREALFYAPATDVERAFLAQDESSKGTVTRAEFATLAPLPSLRSSVPVLVIVGGRDGIFCAQDLDDGGADCTSDATLTAQERTWYPFARSMEAVVVPGVGHALNAFRTAPVVFEAAMRWLDREVPARALT